MPEKKYTIDTLCRDCLKPLSTSPSAKRLSMEVWEINGQFYTRMTGKGASKLVNREVCLCGFEPMTTQEAQYFMDKSEQKMETLLDK